jgi:hypothetical protein
MCYTEERILEFKAIFQGRNRRYKLFKDENSIENKHTNSNRGLKHS